MTPTRKKPAAKKAPASVKNARTPAVRTPAPPLADPRLAGLERFDDLSQPDAVDLFWSRFFDPDDWSLEALAAVATLLPRARAPRAESGLVSFDQSTVVDGDLIVDGDLDVNGHTLVLGDLRCRGYLFTGTHTSLIVTGAIQARAMDALRSYWLVGGPISAEVVWLGTYGTILHRDALRARLLVEEMFLERMSGCGPVEAGTRIVSDYVPEDAAALAQLAALLQPAAYLGEDGTVDAWEILRWASNGRDVFRHPLTDG